MNEKELLELNIQIEELKLKLYNLTIIRLQDKFQKFQKFNKSNK